jgi:hypothetical protein
LSLSSRPTNGHPATAWLTVRPFWGAEWLWVAHFSVDGPDLINTHMVATEFVRGMLEYQLADHAEPKYWVDIESIPCILIEHVRLLARRMRAHTHTPVVVASGFQSLVHKISATLHCFYLARPVLERLAAFLDTFVSFTTDMGCEFGFADFRATNLRDLLSPWFRLSGA